MTDKYILDDEHNLVACDLHTWAKWIEIPGNKIVKQTTLDDGRWVSTVFLGLDHSFSDSGQGIWFETMIFPAKEEGGEQDYTEEFCERYSTWEQAAAGHVLACLQPAEEVEHED